jgi:hypothetical protein
VVQPFDLLGAQLEPVGSRVLLDAGDALGAGDRGDVVSLGEQPGQGFRSKQRSPYSRNPTGIRIQRSAGARPLIQLFSLRLVTRYGTARFSRTDSVCPILG